jgi:hypothetical protein
MTAYSRAACESGRTERTNGQCSIAVTGLHKPGIDHFSPRVHLHASFPKPLTRLQFICVFRSAQHQCPLLMYHHHPELCDSLDQAAHYHNVSLYWNALNSFRVSPLYSEASLNRKLHGRKPLCVARSPLWRVWFPS